MQTRISILCIKANTKDILRGVKLKESKGYGKGKVTVVGKPSEPCNANTGVRHEGLSYISYG